MANLSAAFEGASQGLGQMAGMAMQHEMAEAMAERAENMAILRDQLSTRRELLVTNARGQVLNAVSNNRVAAQHGARDEEINRQEQGRAQNEAAEQSRQFSNAQQLQDSAFANSAELAGRTARVQDRRAAMVQVIKARGQKSQINGWIANYQQQKGYSKDQLMNAAKYDPILRGKFNALNSADALEQSAQATLDQQPGLQTPYGASGPSTTTPPPISLAPPPTEGPGISDNPYPDSSAGDEIEMGGSTGPSGGAGGGDSTTGTGPENQ